MPLRIFMSESQQREHDLKNMSKEEIKARRKEQERERKRREEEAFRSTPKGIARTAKEEGRKVFQYVEKLSETVGAAVPMVGAFTSGQQNEGVIISSIEDIESEGWTLINDNYVFQVTGSVSRDKFLSSGQQEAVSGQLIGIYTFRAVDE